MNQALHNRELKRDAFLSCLKATAAAVASLGLACGQALASAWPGSSVRVYTGSIGQYPIRMTLERQGSRLTGSYRYVRAGVSLRLEGTLSGDRARMQEVFAGRARTALITARLLDNGALEGTWIKRNDGQALPFYARPIGSTVRPNEPARRTDASPPTSSARRGDARQPSRPAIKAHRQSVAGQPSRSRPPAGTVTHSPASSDIGSRLLQDVRKGDTETARAILDEHPQLDPRDSQGHTALMLACTFRNDASEETSFSSIEDRQDFVKFLLNHNADIDAKDSRGYTALMYAAASWGAGNPIIRLLLDAGANVNARNLYRGTALMVATGKYGHVRTVQLLLDAGANPNLRDKYGRTALWYARSHHAYDSAQELERAGGVE